MPTSQWRQISPIIGHILRLEPQSVLDIGVGFGKYGFLAREYLDVYRTHEGPFGQRRTRIDGIEAHEPYITATQKSVYDHIYIGSAMDVVPTLDQHYDLVTAIDVMEHFEPEDAERLIEQLKGIASHVLISVPCVWVEQDETYGNDFERHRSQFTRKQLRELGFTHIQRIDMSYVAIWGARAAERGEPLWRQCLRPLGFMVPQPVRDAAIRVLGRKAA